MHAALNEIDLHHALAIRKHTLAVNARNRRPPARFLKRIGADAVWVGHDALKVGPRLGACNDLGPFCGRRAQAAGMVKMMM